MEHRAEQNSSNVIDAQNGACLVSEMAIVDTFTKLIFGDEDAYASDELEIIAAFRAFEHSVMRDTYQEMGAYLRNLGVREMIELVTGVKSLMSASTAVNATVDMSAPTGRHSPLMTR
ncbi:MAG: hypothetical protein AB8C02_08070 [Halioglobus sp.]